MCSYAGTQTSPSYGSVIDTQKQSSNMSSLSKRSASHNATVPQPKPFPRKCVPRTEWSSRNVQVQVMSPLGLSSARVRGDTSTNRYSVSSQPEVSHYGSAKTVFSEHNSTSALGAVNTSRTDNIPTCRNSVQSSSHYSCGHKPNPDNHVLSPISSVRGQGHVASVNSSPYSSVSPHIQAEYRSMNRRSRSVDSALHGHAPPPEYRTVMRSLINLVTTKSAAENIDLAMEPYSSKMGECGIPPLLVQRYAEELKQDLISVALVMDQVRVQQLCTRRRVGILSRDLPELAGKACDIKISSLPEFFTSIGLPMYSDIFLNEDYRSVEELCKLNMEDIRDITRTHNKHVKRISHALDWVQNRFMSMRKSTSSKDAALMDRV